MRYDSGPATLSLTAGTIDEDSLPNRSGLPPIKAHIFVGEKAAWYEILDDIPQYGRFPPSFEEK